MPRPKFSAFSRSALVIIDYQQAIEKWICPNDGSMVPKIMCMAGRRRRELMRDDFAPLFDSRATGQAKVLTLDVASCCIPEEGTSLLMMKMNTASVHGVGEQVVGVVSAPNPDHGNG